MRVAVPVAEGLLCMHFGHCENFALVDVDPSTKSVTSTRMVVPPPHQPGILPPWLAEQGVTHVIAGGMGGRAIQLFQQAGITVITGAPPMEPQKLVTDYLGGSLQTGENVCDHGPDHIPQKCGH